MIEIIYDPDDPSVPDKQILDLMQKAAELIVSNADAVSEVSEVSLSFATPEEIKDLNKAYRDKDSVTDVLSFPQKFEEEYDEAPGSGKSEGSENDAEPEEPEKDVPYSYGDVVICTERAIAQAEDYGHSPDREILYLFVHGMFHLFGYDHKNEEERLKMREAEEMVLLELNLTRDK